MAYECLGKDTKACEMFSQNIFYWQFERNSCIRELAGINKGVILVDFEKKVMEAAEGAPGFDWFIDDVHYWPPVYQMLSDQILSTVFGYEKTSGADVLAAVSRWRWDGYKILSTKSILNENIEVQSEMVLQLKNPEKVKNFLSRTFNHFELTSLLLKQMHGVYPEIVNEIDHGLSSFDISVASGIPSKSAKDESNVLSMAYCLLGNVFWQEGRYEAALGCLNKAMQLNNANYLTYFFQGLCYYDMGQKAKAEKNFRKAGILKQDFDWFNVKILDYLAKTKKADFGKGNYLNWH